MSYSLFARFLTNGFAKIRANGEPPFERSGWDIRQGEERGSGA